MAARTAPMTAPTSSRVSTRSTRSSAHKRKGTDRDNDLRPGTAPELLQRHENDEEAAVVADLVSERGKTAQRARRSRESRGTNVLSHKKQASSAQPSHDQEGDAGGAAGAVSRPASEEREQSVVRNSAEPHENIEHAGGNNPVEPGSADSSINEQEQSPEIDDRKIMEMIETLPELWDSSRKLVRLLAPADIDANSLRDLTGELQDQGSFRYQNRNKLSTVYSDILSRLYDRAPRLKPSEAQSQLLRRSGIQSPDDIPHESLRADEIFYMANLSVLINEDIPPDGEPPQHNALYFLSEEFPDPYISGIDTGIGATKLLRQTLEVATMLRIECLKSIVFEQGSRPDFVFKDALMHTFYKPDSNKVLKSFGSLPRFRHSSFDKKERRWIGRVVAKVRSIEKAASESGQDLLQALREGFPPEEFAVQLIQWISARGRELESELKSRCEEVEDLQRNLHEFVRRQVRKDSENLPGNLQPAYGFAASRPLKSSSSKNKVTIRSDQNNSRNREFLKQKRAAADRRAEEVRRGKSQEETGIQQDGPPDTVMVVLPSTSQVRKSNLKTGEGSKGHQRSLMDPQPSAVREEWESQKRATSHGDSDYVPENADDDLTATQDEEEKEGKERNSEADDGKAASEQGEEADDFQEDSRNGFQRANRAPGEPAPPVDVTQEDARSTKRQKTGRRNRRDTAAAAAEQRKTSEPTPEESTRAERIEAEYRTSEFVSDRQRRFRDMLEKAKVKASEDKANNKNAKTGHDPVKNPVRNDRARKFWEEVEDDALLAGLATYKESMRPFYDIKKFFELQTPDPLANRSNVDLKDRTRVITFQYLRDGIPLQKGLSKSYLKKNHKEALENMGIDLSKSP